MFAYLFFFFIQSSDLRCDRANYAVLPFALIQLYCEVTKIPISTHSFLVYIYLKKSQVQNSLHVTLQRLFRKVMKTLQRPHYFSKHGNPVGIYLLKINNRNTRTRSEICSKFTKKTPERRPQRRYGVFIVNFENISQLVLVFLLLTLNM